MFKSIIKRRSPEEEELEEKQTQLQQLEEELSQRELDLATLAAELQSYEQLYMAVMGWRYAELDEILARVAKLRADQNPTDSEAQTEYTRAEEQARASAESASEYSEEVPEEPFSPPEDLRKLYRQVAKRVHPDLASDDEDRELRTRLMAEANQAYEQGDEARLRALLEQYEERPEAIKGDSIGEMLVKLIRKIAQIRKRLGVIEQKIAELETTPIGQLYTQALQSGNSIHHLLEHLAKHTDSEIADALECWATFIRERSWD